jgi:hypothetical protein
MIPTTPTITAATAAKKSTGHSCRFALLVVRRWMARMPTANALQSTAKMIR